MKICRMFSKNDNFCDLYSSFKGKVLRFYDEEGFAMYKIIVGITDMLNGDWLLHMIDVEGIDSIEQALNKNHNVDFNLLSTLLGKDGFSFIQDDQFSD